MLPDQPHPEEASRDATEPAREEIPIGAGFRPGTPPDDDALLREASDREIEQAIASIPEASFPRGGLLRIEAAMAVAAQRVELDAGGASAPRWWQRRIPLGAALAASVALCAVTAVAVRALAPTTPTTGGLVAETSTGSSLAPMHDPVEDPAASPVARTAATPLRIDLPTSPVQLAQAPRTSIARWSVLASDGEAR